MPMLFPTLQQMDMHMCGTAETTIPCLQIPRLERTGKTIAHHRVLMRIATCQSLALVPRGCIAELPTVSGQSSEIS